MTDFDVREQPLTRETVIKDLLVQSAMDQDNWFRIPPELERESFLLRHAAEYGGHILELSGCKFLFEQVSDIYGDHWVRFIEKVDA